MDSCVDELSWPSLRLVNDYHWYSFKTWCWVIISVLIKKTDQIIMTSGCQVDDYSHSGFPYFSVFPFTSVIINWNNWDALLIYHNQSFILTFTHWYCHGEVCSKLPTSKILQIWFQPNNFQALKLSKLTLTRPCQESLPSD